MLSEIEQQAIKEGWFCDYCGTVLTEDNIEHHEGKSEITVHTTCYEQATKRMNELGEKWADGWKPIPPDVKIDYEKS